MSGPQQIPKSLHGAHLHTFLRQTCYSCNKTADKIQSKSEQITAKQLGLLTSVKSPLLTGFSWRIRKCCHTPNVVFQWEDSADVAFGDEK